MKSPRAAIIAILIGVGGLAVFRQILYDGKIGSAAFVTLFALLCLACFVVYGFPRLEVLDLKNLRLILTKLETVKEEIYAKEQDLKRASLLLADFILVESHFYSRVLSEKGIELRKRWARKQTRDLLCLFSASTPEVEHALRFDSLLQRFDAAKDAKESGQLWDEIMEKLRAECEEPSPSAPSKHPFP
jgi:hypothetical protein